MVISRTPFRISFLGGGTDLPDFYQGEEGAVVSTTIDKYIYVTVNKSFDETYRLSHAKTEICRTPQDIQHKIFRSVLEKYDTAVRDRHGGCGLEITSIADIPAGTGLGSSSSFTVALLHALHAQTGRYPMPEALAQEACAVEIEELGEPIGKQDQYAAAYGGLQYIRFLPSGQVLVEPIHCSQNARQALQASILLFYTGMTRSASDVFSEWKRNTERNRENLREMRSLAHRMKLALEGGESVKRVGELLHEGWTLKKTLAAGISGSRIDEWYDRAREAGAYGGKIVGAGGGGFLMVVCDPNKQDAVCRELQELRSISVGLESFGSRIIFVG